MSAYSKALGALVTGLVTAVGAGLISGRGAALVAVVVAMAATLGVYVAPANTPAPGGDRGALNPVGWLLVVALVLLILFLLGVPIRVDR